MCEIFGITSNRKVHVNGLLKKFFAHSEEHRNGWGIALFDGGSASVEKEPVTANDSAYLKARLTGSFDVAHMVAHIRRATCGDQAYDNTHPFTMQDVSGRTWTLVHNGHIFEGPKLRRYLNYQKGSTDSERILYYIVDEVNKRLGDIMAAFDINERFHLIDSITRELSPENKLNFILFDGEYMYVHCNEAGGLHVKDDGGSMIFSTKPLTSFTADDILNFINHE